MSNGRDRELRYGGYKPVPTEQVRAMAEQQGNRYDSIFKSGATAWKPHPGTNLIRFLPPTWENYSHYAFKCFVHQFVGFEQGSYLCLLKHQRARSCPCCREAELLKQKGDEEEARKAQWQERHVAWILDREGDDPNRPQLFNMSFTQNRDIQAIRFERRAGDALWIDHPDEGFDLSFERIGQQLKTRYSSYRLDRHASPISEDPAVRRDVLNYITDHPVPEMLQFYPPDYLERAFLITGPTPPKDQRGHDLLSGNGHARYEDEDEIDTTPKEEPRRAPRTPVYEEEEPAMAEAPFRDEPRRPSSQSIPRETMRRRFNDDDR